MIIGQIEIGLDLPPYYIADIAANHNGSIERAYELIELAKKAGAHAAKFQNFCASAFVSAKGFKIVGQLSHQSNWQKSVYQTYEDASLPSGWSLLLKAKCDEVGIEYMTSPYDIENIELADKFVNAFKVGSGDITYHKILQYIALKGKPVLLATGASALNEVKDAVAFFDKSKLVIMQCNTNYTADQSNFKYINLNVLKTYAREFPNVILGLSDHTFGYAAVVGAIALGARVIEKHFTDNNDQVGPDHKFSMNPAAFKEMVAAGNEVFRALGDGIKRIEENEKQTAIIQRRGLYASRDICSGERITLDHCVAFRPALPSGFAANELSAIVGKKALKDIRKGESISRKVIEQTASVPRLYRRRVAAAVTGGCNPPLTPMPCGFAGKPVKPARQLSNNLSALRASNWTSQFETRKDAAMKAAFRIDAGAQIGMGHFVRMSALAEALTEKGCACDFFTRENEPIDYTGFDIVFVDTYLVTDEYISALNELNALVVCYDENALYKYSCDLLINSNLYANDLKFQFGAKIPQMLLGGKYALLRKEFRERDSILIRKEATRVFICFGGTDVRNCTPDVVACLQALPNIELAVVLGEMTQCDDEVAKVADDHVSIFKNPDSIAEIMRGCDIAVISAGSIVYESAALGLPALLIVQADNQERIAGYMTSNCLMKCVGNWENLSMRYLFDETISLLADYERRYSESGRLRESVDQNGVYNVSNVVLEMKNNQRDTAT